MRMRTLLVTGDGDPPQELRAIVEAGSTEVQTVSADELSPDEASRAERLVIWNKGEVQILSGPAAERTDASYMRWPDDEDKVRLLLNTSG